MKNKESKNGGSLPADSILKKKGAPQEEDDNEFLKKQQKSRTAPAAAPTAIGHGPRGGPFGGGMIREKPKNTARTLIRILKYVGHDKLLVTVTTAIMIVGTFLNLLSPMVQAFAINALTGTAEHPGVDFTTLRLSLAFLLFSYAAVAVFAYLSGIIAAKLSQYTVYTLRRDLFAKIACLPIKYIDGYKHGDLMSRMTNDVENISNTVSQSIGSLVSGVITIIGSLFLMLAISWQMTVVAFITIPMSVFVSTYLARFMRKYFVKQQRLLGSLNSHIEEMVTGYKTVLAYGREGEAKRDFTVVSGELKRVAVKANVLGGAMGPLMNIIGNLNFLLIAVLGGAMALKGTVSVGYIQSFLQYSRNFTRPINEIANQYSSILTAVAGAERIFEILDAPSESGEGGAEIDLASVKGELSFEDVSFAYKKGEPVLDGFNLEVNSGQKIAIVGRTGSGKTTIVNLLTRFYDIDRGKISLDGRDICGISKRSLRRTIAIVLQDTVLFSDTIAANIRYGRPDAALEDVKAAAETAEADVFIGRLPQGYDTVLTESAGNLSQGQRQLLSISRAVLADPKILILDEATSNVDTRTEMQIQSAMLKLMAGRTSLVIAHRLSTIRDADKIIVLDGGKIAECGSHAELLAAGGVYYSLYKTQFAGIAT